MKRLPATGAVGVVPVPAATVGAALGEAVVTADVIGRHCEYQIEFTTQVNPAVQVVGPVQS